MFRPQLFSPRFRLLKLPLVMLAAALVGVLIADCRAGGSDAGAGAGGAAPTCVDPPDGPQPDIYCAGLYLDRDPSRIAPDAIPYTPGVTFWSDGAEKQRYLYLPPGGVIDTSSMDAWRFPVGTKAWKEFRLDGKLVETRLLWKRDEGRWEHATYVWNDAGDVATLNAVNAPTVLPGGYEIPATGACDKCHGGGADKLLGVEAVALALPTADGVTLATLAQEGRLSAPPSPLAIELPDDATGKGAAALGYMHMNCGVACHSARGLSGFTQLHMRLRAEEFWPAPSAPAATLEATDAYVTGINADVILATYAQAFPGTKLLTPGSHEKSLAWAVAHLRGEHQMPPIVSHQIDAAGTQLLADWLDALTPTP